MSSQSEALKGAVTLNRKDLEKVKKVFVKQRRRGCCKFIFCDCCGLWPSDEVWDVIDADADKKKPMLKLVSDAACCSKLCCLCRCSYNAHIYDPQNDDDELYRLSHPRLCCAWCPICKCCRHKMEVFTVEDSDSEHKDDVKVPIGRVIADWKLCCSCFPSFTVYGRGDEEEHRLYQVEKKFNCCQKICCCCGCCFKTGFKIDPLGENAAKSVKDKKAKKSYQGQIRKEIALREIYTDADTYLIEFPTAANEQERVLLLTAMFLIDATLDNDTPAKQDMD